MNTARMGGHPCARARLIREWQDLRAVRDLRASDGENALWWQDVRAVHSPTALCGAFRMHSTHILPKLAVFEYIQAICCHEPVLFSSEAPSGTHRGTISPSRHRGGCGAAVSAGGWAFPARGSRASPNGEISAPAQRIAAHTAVPPPRQRKASALLAFLCCFVYGSSGPRASAVTRRLPSGSSSVGGSAFGEIALHVRFANRQCTRRPSRTLAKTPS